MAFKIGERVKETTTTTGTGTYSLEGASTGFQAFSAIGNGNTCPYLVTNGTDWEVGIGTYTSGSPSTLARTTILASSNAGAAVNWASGSKDVSVVLPASLTKMRSASTGGQPVLADYVGVTAKAAGFTLANADKGKLFDCSGSFTITMPSVSTLDADWWVEIVNNGTGTITVNRAGSDLLVGAGLAQGGATSFTLPYNSTTVGLYNVSAVKLYKKESTKVAVAAVREVHGAQVFTADGTWTCPEGVTTAWVSGCGAGGAGGGYGAAAYGGGGGGGGGQSAFRTRVSVVPGTAYTVTVGEGGTGVSGAGGNNGEASSVGALLTLAGGTGGGVGTAGQWVFGSGGAAGGAGGGTGGMGLGWDFAGSGTGAKGGDGGGTVFAAPRAGGATGTTGQAAGTVGCVYGGGGTGGYGVNGTATAGGNGANGIIIIEW